MCAVLLPLGGYQIAVNKYIINLAYHKQNTDQNAYMDEKKNTTKLHAPVFLMMNTWMFETCRRRYN